MFPATVCTQTCAHTLFLAGGSDVSEVGLEEIAFPCFSWHTVCGHPRPGTSSAKFLLEKCRFPSVWLFACHNSQEQDSAAGCWREVPCADAEECRGSNPNMLCMVAHSICSSMVVLLSFMLTSNKILKNISTIKMVHKVSGFHPQWERSGVIMLSEISLSLWMCIEFKWSFLFSFNWKRIAERCWTPQWRESQSIFRSLLFIHLFFLHYSIVVLTREHLPQHSHFPSCIVSPSPLPL